MHMIQVYTTENSNDWDHKLEPLLYAYWSVSEESTGFSPFELLFGWKARGPLNLLQQNWEELREEDPESVIQYIDTLMNSLQQSLKIAAENLKRHQGKQKHWYDKRARERTFHLGDEVLILKPIKGNKLQLNWASPFRIVSKMSEVNYIIQEEGEEGWRVVHVTMIKPYRKENDAYVIKEVDNEKHEL